MPHLQARGCNTQPQTFLLVTTFNRFYFLRKEKGCEKQVKSDVFVLLLEYFFSQRSIIGARDYPKHLQQIRSEHILFFEKFFFGKV